MAPFASSDPSYAIRMGRAGTRSPGFFGLAIAGAVPRKRGAATCEIRLTASARLIHSGARLARFGSVLLRAFAVTTVTGSPSFLTWLGRSRCSQREVDLGIVEMMISS